MLFRVTNLPDGLTNYQLKQWSENFEELQEKMLQFGFKDDVKYYFRDYFIKIKN